MRKISAILVTSILPLLALSTTADVNNPSVKAYSEAYYNGDVVGFSDQHIASGKLDIINYTTNQTRRVEALYPVKANNISSLQISDGYCVIVSTGETFEGSRKVFGPGNYATLPSPFNNNIESIAIYEQISDSPQACDPEKEIPYVYDQNFSGNSYPLPFANGVVLPNNEPCEHYSQACWSTYAKGGNFEYNTYSGSNFIYLGSYLRADQRRHSSGVGYRVGAFSQKASSLSIPKCYEVTLQKTNGAKKTFTEGRHSLGYYGYSDNTWRAEVTLLPNCVQSEAIPEPEPDLPEGEDCEWQYYSSSSSGNSYSGHSETVYQSVGECKHDYKIVVNYWAPNYSGSTTNYQ